MLDPVTRRITITMPLPNPPCISQGGFGYGTLNKGGEQILELCTRHHLAIVNTFFNKEPEHLITYKSGNKQSQIDYILTNLSKLNNNKDPSWWDEEVKAALRNKKLCFTTVAELRFGRQPHTIQNR
ncbi:unnamed protein product [Parnassius apollo]|uniref:(apollo) hypothetical protein n=1 Tax=Parnassius apollo TaxID=110799 RepID=A0A8S3XZ11_PARAO|nr:unnamed protein product [Parnassius apollo]